MQPLAQTWRFSKDLEKPARTQLHGLHDCSNEMPKEPLPTVFGFLECEYSTYKQQRYYYHECPELT